ncbi:MAG: DUF1045 domain-containing protein [Pseudomonadota bacterium]
MTHARYAVYFQPAPDTPLGAFGAGVLGYDVASGQDVTRIAVPGLSTETLASLTETPRTYGFHATLKAPFYPREGVNEADIFASVAALARDLQTPAPLRLTVRLLANFIALTPSEADPGLAALASRCVTDLDHLRAPLTLGDRARRLKSGLTGRQIANLDAYGYPHVHEDFRFHMTLTGQVPDSLKDTARDCLAAQFAMVAQPTALDALAVAKQADRNARFVVARRFPIGR